MIRLAVVVSHPIQYYAPWFRELAQELRLHLKVFYLWDFGVSHHCDRGFGQIIVGFWWKSQSHGCERKTALGARRGPGDAARGIDGSAEAPRAVGVGLGFLCVSTYNRPGM